MDTSASGRSKYSPQRVVQEEGAYTSLPFIFPSSQNLLEDQIGFSVATTISAFWGMSHDNNSMILDKGIGAVAGVRVGTGALWALLYTIPEAYAFVLLVHLLLRAKAHGVFQLLA